MPRPGKALMTLIASAGFLLAIAAYAQWQIPNFVAQESRSLALRLLLVFLGVAVGIMMGRTWPTPDPVPPAMFFIGFGLVHVPAALILFFKRQRGEGRT